MTDKRLSLSNAGEIRFPNATSVEWKAPNPRTTGYIGAPLTTSIELTKEELAARDVEDQAMRQKNWTTIVEPILRAERDDNSFFGPTVARSVRSLRKKLHL